MRKQLLYLWLNGFILLLRQKQAKINNYILLNCDLKYNNSILIVKFLSKRFVFDKQREIHC